MNVTVLHSSTALSLTLRVPKAERRSPGALSQAMQHSIATNFGKSPYYSLIRGSTAEFDALRDKTLTPAQNRARLDLDAILSGTYAIAYKGASERIQAIAEVLGDRASGHKLAKAHAICAEANRKHEAHGKQRDVINGRMVKDNACFDIPKAMTSYIIDPLSMLNERVGVLKRKVNGVSYKLARLGLKG